MKTLFPPQQRSHDALVAAMRKHGAALDSSVTGSGKTLKAVEVSRSLGFKPLVICPKIVIPAWKAAFVEQSVEHLDVLNYEKLRAGNTPWLKKVGRTFHWTLPPGTMLIWDEAHRCKGIRSKNALMLVCAKRLGLPNLMLSATAAEDPSEMRAIGFALGLHKDTDFAMWAKRWGCVLNPWKKLEFPLKSRPKLVELHDLIYPDRGHKVSRDEMGDYFQDTSIITDPIDFGDEGEISALYAEMEKELGDLADQSAKDKGASVLTTLLRARQTIEIVKVPTLAELVKECVEEERCSAVVFLNFRASMDALAERLACPVGFIHGDQTAVERQQEIEAFQADDTHVMICQLSAGGVGVSLHDLHGNRPRRSFISPSYNAKEIDQALGRIDRAGARTGTVQRILFAAGTVEEEVARSFRKKLQNLKILHADLDNTTSYDESVSMPPTNEDNNGAPPATSGGNVNGEVADTDAATPSPEEPAHAKHSPSKLKYLELCPGFQGRDSVNPAAEMGTRIHLALETGDLDSLKDDWERLIAESCLETLDLIVERHGFRGGEIRQENEVRFQIALGEGIDTFGTCDLFMVRGDEAVMIDWKTGKGSIDDASINTQAQAYVLGAFQREPSVQRIHFYFVIPQRDEVTFHTYTRGDMGRIKLRLSTIIRRAEEAHKNFGSVRGCLNPQPNLCEYCALQWKCSAVTEKVFDIARKYGTDGLPVPDVVHGSEIDDPAELAKLLMLKPVVERWLDGVSARAKEFAFELGVEIPGFEPKERAGSKSVSSPLAAWEAAKTIDPELELDEFLAALGPVSFNSVADVIYQRAPRGKKTAVKNQFEDELDELGVLERKPPSQYLQVQR